MPKLLSYLSLYGAHGLKVFSFIILIPHFTSIFPKSVWGQILTVQALALWFQIIIEYGFNLSATRSISRVKADELAISSLVAGVMGAKIILSLIVIALSILSVLFLDSISGLGHLVFCATVFAIAQGFNPIWYFLARGKFTAYASIDFINRFLYLVACFFLIKHENQGQMIFIYGSLTALFANMYGYFVMNKQIGLKLPDLYSSLRALREGAGLFAFVGITSVYTTLNVVILGFSQSSSLVALYGTADRVVRAIGGVFEPLNRIAYANLSYLYHVDRQKAMILLRKSSLTLALFGLAVFIFGETFASALIKLFLPNYLEATVYVKILLFFIPVLILNNIYGLYIMLPNKMDRQFNVSFIVASILSFIAMVWLIPRYGATALAWITVATEGLACVFMVIQVSASGILTEKEV
ncbi:oligosaccharide flippase family protein [Deinococcus detaillensis]|uniref:Oligosaccharide flippase family protein n=1 Tax=Deinococcus detaillensis TaxID=2592048 RepID=A0A553V0Y9_9DEIO|nr:oligosaccharide flippase family protein [Deinococcus detaillensis]TSA86138.1 oligosaccharide flippase family protein [Deinococcus detaillensis]